VHHTSTYGAWSATADRFIADGIYRKTPTYAFRDFKYEVNLCSGKKFARTQLAAFAAMLAMRFDVLPAAGLWIELGQNLTRLSLYIVPPRKQVAITFVPRMGAQGCDGVLEG